VGTGATAAVGGGLYYLVASTLAVPGLFLLADVIARNRGAAADRLERAPRMPAAGLTGTAFFVLAVAMAGMPPLAGFLGKLMILQGAGAMPWLWGVILAASLLNIVALAKAGSRMFWNLDPVAAPAPADPADVRHLAAPALLVALLVAVTVAAGPATRFAQVAAAGVLDPADYRLRVLGEDNPRGWMIEVREVPAPGEQEPSR
jgi:multicomponent K+:H+ antiporter subunit D